MKAVLFSSAHGVEVVDLEYNPAFDSDPAVPHVLRDARGDLYLPAGGFNAAVASPGFPQGGEPIGRMYRKAFVREQTPLIGVAGLARARAVWTKQQGEPVATVKKGKARKARRK